MNTIIATLKVFPEKSAEFETMLRRLVAGTAGEPGAVVYEYASDPKTPGVFTVYERYADQAAMDAHLASAHLKAMLAEAAPLLAQEPVNHFFEHRSGIRSLQVTVEGRAVSLQVIPLGPANLVFAQTSQGILACGAIDPAALQKFGLPVARLKPPVGKPSIANLDDLLGGEVREANAGAEALGIRVGMSGREALRLL